MTEAEWSACCDSDRMLDFVRGTGRATERKLRLFSVAYCRRRWEWLPEGPCRRLVEVAERLADGRVSEQKLREARAGEVILRSGKGQSGAEWDAQLTAVKLACASAEETGIAAAYATIRLGQEIESLMEEAAIQKAMAVQDPGEAMAFQWGEARREEQEQQCVLLRELFGNPFRASPVIERSWRTLEVVALATAIYEYPPFERTRELASALAAGCDDAELLGHLRSEGPHVRGCFAIDVILGKN